MSATQPYIPRSGERVSGHDRFRRSRMDHLRVWWREIDRVLLGLVLLLMLIGTAAVATASVASARRLSTADVTLPDLYFYWAHIRWQLAGVVVMLGASTLSLDNARRIGILLAGAMFVLLALVPVLGVEVNGARRWISIGMRFQPSEFLKPAFAIALAWVLTWRLRDPDLPVIGVVSGAMGAVGLLLMLQPNLGDAILFGGVWFVMIMLAGVSLPRLGGLIAGGFALLTAAYFLYDNARHRIDAFFGGGTEYDQVDLAEKTLLAGGWSGTGMWLGIRKLKLPEAHTDYIFSVIGEEFGLLICMIVVLLYLALMVRVLVRLTNEDNLFIVLAATGLVTQIGGQAFINILVNLQLFPSKGMTLPLVSYGGSSTIAICLTVGLLLAITRRNPFLSRGKGGIRERLAEVLPKREGPGS